MKTEIYNAFFVSNSGGGLYVLRCIMSIPWSEHRILNIFRCFVSLWNLYLRSRWLHLNIFILVHASFDALFELHRWHLLFIILSILRGFMEWLSDWHFRIHTVALFLFPSNLSLMLFLYFISHNIRFFDLAIALISAAIQIILRPTIFSMAKHYLFLSDGGIVHFLEVVYHAHDVWLVVILPLFLWHWPIFVEIVDFRHHIFFLLIFFLNIDIINKVFHAREDRVAAARFLIGVSLCAEQLVGPFSHLRVSHFKTLVCHCGELFDSILTWVIETRTHNIALSLNIEIFLANLVITRYHLFAYLIKLLSKGTGIDPSERWKILDKFFELRWVKSVVVCGGGFIFN